MGIEGKILGRPTTVGDMKSLLANFPDDMVIMFDDLNAGEIVLLLDDFNSPDEFIKITLTKNQRIGSEIKKYRQIARMTQTELAKKVGIPQSHLSRLECGKHIPSDTTIEKIALALCRRELLK